MSATISTFPGGVEEVEIPDDPPELDEGVRLEDFYAFMPQHKYMWAPGKDLWPPASVNGRLPRVPLVDTDGIPVRDANGRPVKLKASAWLDKFQTIEQMTWAPGEPAIIQDRLIYEGGWIARNDVKCFNLYQPPLSSSGNPQNATRWVDHIGLIYPDDAEHIISWFAHRVQHPEEKINHALVLGGKQGIGKDTMFEPVKRAVGPWNVSEPSPQQLLGRFNGFVKSVILRISEARDLGEIDRFGFYEHLKVLTAAPPDVLRVDEKNLREHNVLNVCGVVITTNYKAGGIYLPADDRRHYVAWSRLSRESFSPGYWNDLWQWYDAGGDRDVAAFLAQLDLSGFDPKAPPPKTAAFWDIVNTARASEDAELTDVIELMGSPDVLSLRALTFMAFKHKRHDFHEWLGERRNRRVIPHRLETCEYVPVRNPDAKDGLWKIDDRRQVVYGRSHLTFAEQIKALKEELKRPIETIEERMV